jgi:hypothetical protein
MVPDCTLITGCFNTNKFNQKTRTMEDIIKALGPLLEIPCYILFFGDPETIQHIRNKREEYGLSKLSNYIESNIEDIWSFQYHNKVKENRDVYWPTRDERTCNESHLITCNKFDFVLQGMEMNPFQTSKFGWIDAFALDNYKICQDYYPTQMLHILDNITDKFHIQILNVCDKKYKQEEWKREYYNQYRWVVCGGMFTCGKNIGRPILNRLKEIFVNTTESGYGHGEEMFYLEVLDEFYDDIHRSYGDYGQIMNNFIRPTRNIDYIIHVILQNYINHGYHREAYDCSTELLSQIESYTLFVGWENYMRILFLKFVASFYCKPSEEVKSFLNHVYSVIESNPYIKKEYMKQKDFYDQQFGFSL